MVAGGSETGEAAMGKGGVMAAGDGGLAGWSLQTAIFSNRHRQMDAVWFGTTARTEVWADGSCGRPYFAKRYLQMDVFWFVTTACRGLRALPGGKERCFGCFRRVEREVVAVLSDGFLRTALFC